MVGNVALLERWRAPLAASHAGRGWEKFTDAVVRLVNDRPEPMVFLLWGRHALRKAAHPSPLSACNGFFGCRHFSKASIFLQSNDLAPIDWALPEV